MANAQEDSFSFLVEASVNQRFRIAKHFWMFFFKCSDQTAHTELVGESLKQLVQK